MRIGAKIGVESPKVDQRVAPEHACGRGRAASLDKSGEIPRLDVARALARLLGRVDPTSPDPARAAQLEILRNAVATGRYQPDLVAVARKLLVEVAAEPRW
jgi:anti-sigma28 factor (negative regulator of flagellin synthesis)